MRFETAMTEQKTYKKTLNLPKTSFSMKANLVQNEPASIKRWDGMDLYRKVRQARQGAKPYVFHDGPPYANGSIHLGHLLNKVLKDLVVRSKTMAGYDCPFIPGWDCHGLPIEHKVMQELGDAARQMDALAIRRKCQKYAAKFQKLQRGQMERLLTVGDYDEPYLTMAPEYEAGVMEVFAELIDQGVVYRALKPVHWSPDNQTALAEAELEYYDREDTSVFVLFESTDPAACGFASPFSLMIWTTTPWTLPANLAVAVHERFEYGFYQLEDGRVAVIACELAKQVLRTDEPKPLTTVTGKQLLGVKYKHPFVDRTCPVVAADYVTLEDGTGLVHTAPGHGAEDYHTGLKEGLDVYCPVREDGTFDDTAPDWLQGKSIWDANDLVVEHLRASGHLFYDHKFTHSYPHDWRGKTPVIFRATEQWFIGVDRDMQRGGTLRGTALDLTADQIKFIPDWGRNRMRGMLESRPDWCLSRQRAWGLPIPWFHMEGESEPLLTRASVKAVAAMVREHGSDVWFKASAQELLADYDADSDPDAPDWTKAGRLKSPRLTKGADTFDVWFESGSSWHACMQQRVGDEAVPTDLYLEGSDQHRGWFQHSLLPALGATGKPAFTSVLTHGFILDKNSRAMSKSLGNTIEVEDLLKDFGADVCRWWVSSLNTDNDIKADNDFFKVAGEEYRKVRNTIRFLLSNLSDYEPAAGDVEGNSIDAWALVQLNKLIERVRGDYELHRYACVHEELFRFCNETMSAVYLAATKDRLYCDAPGSPRRRRTQQVMHTITDALIRLVAPILPHTADEAWRVLHGENGCVHVELFPDAQPVSTDVDWDEIMRQRDLWLKAIEDKRQQDDVDNPLDLGVRAAAPAQLDPVDLADLCGVSRFELIDGDAIEVVDLRDEPRCERSWKRDGTVSQRSDGGMLSDRDAAAIGV